MASSATSAINYDNDIEGSQKLQDIFLSGWNLYEELENTDLLANSNEYQEKVKKAIEYMEQATCIVNQVNLFSANELLDEVSTESLQYILLPYFLGKLVSKLNRPNDLEVIDLALVYFTDHLRRCAEYELCENMNNTTVNQETNKPTTQDELQSLMRAANDRNAKIAQYKKMKELDEYIKKMRIALKNSAIDDEDKRKFYLKFIERSIIDARSELKSLNDLKAMIKMHQDHRISGGEVDNASCSKNVHNHSHMHTHGKPKPMQPFIIARDATQKAVFGMGYPSLPIMTVNDFYQQRVDEGIFPDAEKSAQINQAQALAQAAIQDPSKKEEAEKAAEELEIENEDPEYLARMRRLDEYKDSVRRGDGNRYNRS